MRGSFPERVWLRQASKELSLEKSGPFLEDLSSPCYLFERDGQTYLAQDGEITLDPRSGGYPIVAFDGVQNISRLGDPRFLTDYHLKYPYLTGGMAHGVSSAKMVTSMGKAGMLGFFGAGGLPIGEVERAIVEMREALGSDSSYGVNLVSRITDPGYEMALVDLFLRHRVRIIEASAFVNPSPALVKYRLAGIREGPGGEIVVPNKIFAKTSREEIVSNFLAPPPSQAVSQLLNEKAITAEEAHLAGHIPLAEEIIVEADSGGHTDNRPAILLVPNVRYLLDRTLGKHQYGRTPLRIGAAGGIATPQSLLAAFVLGADFVMTGSINQSCVEAATSGRVKELLCEASMHDVANAPAADLFEMGGKVQVLTRGSMFHARANKLFELFRRYSSVDEIPLATRNQLEKTIFRKNLEDIWVETKNYFAEMDPFMLRKGEKNPKTKMALIFRWYLARSLEWARMEHLERKLDFQIMCGPSMGAFNQWVKGSPLERPENRRAVDVAMRLMGGALYLNRVQSILKQGVLLPKELLRASPRVGDPPCS